MEEKLKLCGYYEPCFIPGSCWGHLEGCMCKYLGEDRVDGKPVGTCSANDKIEIVNVYCCEWQYKEILDKGFVSEY